MSPRSASRAGLRRLASLYGVQTSYADMEHRRVSASPESLLSVLRGLGVDTDGDLDRAFNERLRSLWDGYIEPVIVAWDGELPAVELRLPASAASGRVLWRLKLKEGGET